MKNWLFDQFHVPGFVLALLIVQANCTGHVHSPEVLSSAYMYCISILYVHILKIWTVTCFLSFFSLNEFNSLQFSVY